MSDICWLTSAKSLSPTFWPCPTPPQGHGMSVKCEEPIDELTAKVWLLYDHPNFKYCKTLIIRVTLFSRDLIFARPLHWIYLWDFISAIYCILVYITYITNYWRGLYFRVLVPLRIYAKIKSSRIKSVLQYCTLLVSGTELRTNRQMDGESKHEMPPADLSGQGHNKKIISRVHV